MLPIACFLLLLLDSVGSRAQQRDLRTQADQLAVELGKASEVSDELKKSLIQLRAAIETLENKIPPEARVADDPAAFITRTNEVALIAGRILGRGTLSITPALTAKASEHIAQIQGFALIDPTKAAIDRAVALLAVIATDPTAEPPVLSPHLISTYPQLRTAINKLIPALGKVEELDILDAVKRRAKSLETLVSEATAVGPTPSVEAIQKLSSLQTAITNYQMRVSAALVDIIVAEYGDMRDHASPPRRPGQLCDATIAMRKACQGKPSCKLPADFKTTLCAKDPAELAPANYKGAWVMFRCLDTRLIVYPAPQLPGMVPAPGQATWVPLKTATDEFSCTPQETPTR